MCILCVIQKWSWRVATMLPWLVIPLIGLWALSQLLPPPYRFEVTGPRLACVFVLLVTLVWYQYLMPCLSAWRVRRNARWRERKRFEAVELQKLRKTATKRCRNCFTPYRDQNPGGGRYMCSYYGHLSKRPVLDLPIPSGLGISNSGIITELFGKGGKILNGKAWYDNSSFSHDWLNNGGWVASASVPGRSSYASGKSSAAFFAETEHYLDEKSHPRASFLPGIWMTSFVKSIKWSWRKLFRISSLIDEADIRHRGMVCKRGDHGHHYQESRVEKARRKAEEKRQARLEKEHLEEEEKKQREEVARMVEERRRLRDEKTEAENRVRGSSQREEKKREAEKRRQERKRDKDKSSSKSNSDVEEIMEKKLGRENEWKVDTNKKTETAQMEYQGTGIDLMKGDGLETTCGGKRSPHYNYGHGNTGSRYLDRMRGTIISSSKVFTSGSFFGKASRTPVHVLKDKSNGFVDHLQPSTVKRELCPPERVQEKLLMHGDGRIKNELVGCEPQRKTAPKSWQQLFTKSPTAPALNTDIIGRPNRKCQPEVINPQAALHSPPPLTCDNPINFSFSSPFTIPTLPNAPMNVSSCLVGKDNSFTHLGETRSPVPEEPELFEDPCYVPDPVSLLGPVSESLHNFQLDLGSGFIPHEKEIPRSLICTSVSMDTTRQSPIVSPISPLRDPDERQNYVGHVPCSSKAQDAHPYSLEDFNSVSEKGLWQMWNTSPVLQDGLAYLGNHSDWVSPLEWSRPPHKEDANSVRQKTMASLFSNERQLPSGTHPPQNSFLGNGQSNGEVFGSPLRGSNNDPWLQKSFHGPYVDDEDRSSVKTTALTSQKNTVYDNPVRGSTNDSLGLMSQTSYWSQNELAVRRSSSNEGVVGNQSSVVIPSAEGGGLYYTPIVQSLRSFE